MENYQKMEELFNLAMQMQESAEGISIEDMMSMYNISRRTAERRRLILNYIFPQMHEVDTGERIKRWRIPQRSLNTLISFSSEELAVFKTAINLLKRNGMQDKSEILQRIETKLRLFIKPEQKRRIEVDAEGLMMAEGITCFPGPHLNIAPEIIQTIQNAILGCHLIKMIYTKKNGETSTYRLRPYGFLYGQRNHYLVAKHSDGYDHGRAHNYTLTGIQAVEELSEPYEEDDFSLEQYAKDSFGTWQEEPFDVEWLFDAVAAPEAKHFIFHPTQQMTENPDGTLTVKFRAGGSLEMDWHLYTWGKHVKVIKPENWQDITDHLDY